MRILHVLDHSIPLQSGYTFRTRAILKEQQALGWETLQVTGPKHNLGESVAAVEEVDGLTFHRSPGEQFFLDKLPFLGQWRVIQVLAKRLMEVASRERPDILHAHSPALNGVAAVRVGKNWEFPLSMRFVVSGKMLRSVMARAAKAVCAID